MRALLAGGRGGPLIFVLAARNIYSVNNSIGDELMRNEIRSLKDLVEIKRMLARPLIEALPMSIVRRKEWSVDNGLQVSVTACLRCPLPVTTAESLLTKMSVSIEQSEQIRAMLELPCWRHTLRIDQAGGISLYIERDWDYRLLAIVCSWFAVSSRPVDIVQELNEKFGGVVAGVGIHWCRSGKTRIRLYTVFRKYGFASRERTELFLKLITDQFSCTIPLWVFSLLVRQRRALVVNIEEKNRNPVIKLEMPDVEWSEIADIPILERSSPTVLFQSDPPVRLCYLGVRLSDIKNEANTTFYLPYAYPTKGEKN